jgi:tetratricopeptide (TPR) repeat protein
MAVAEQSMDHTGNAASASDFTYHALACSEALAPKNAPPDAARAARIVALRERAVARLTAVANDPTAPLSVDDRSDALMYLREALASLGRKDEAKQVAEQQRELLDETAAKAPTPTAASTYNWPRAEVYTYLERPLDLAPALEQSVRDLPTDYDPPARLGWIYLKGGKLEEAARWTEASIALAYGPRKVRVLNQRADIAAKQGDKATEKQFRAQIVTTLEALPPSQTSPEAIAKAKQAVADLEKPVAAK